MRRGLRPLSVHIGMATSYWPGAFGSEQVPPPDDMPDDLQKMLLGIRRYQLHPYKAEREPLDIIFQEGSVTLGAIPGHDYDNEKPAVVLIPSLINKACILDLKPERSMLHWLASQDINPYLLDWGDIINDPGQSDMEGVVFERLLPVIKSLQQKTGGKVHALGYCMGGTVLVAAAAQAQNSFQSITLLASPWDFHGGTQALLKRVKFWLPSAVPTIEEKGSLSVDWIQMLFASMDPAMTVKKFANFYDMDQDSEEARRFIAVEDWLNDGVDLPAGVAQHCIQNWFLDNQPGNGEWVVGSHKILPDDVTCPVLIVASDKDRLVEFETACVLKDQLKEVKLHNPGCGHISMIAGRRSVEDVWQPIAQWICEQT